MTIATINPATGDTLKTFTPLTEKQIADRLRCASEAFRVNRNRSFADRAQRMRKAAELLDSRAAEYGKLMTTEMGKTISSAIAEAKKCALACRYYAENAERFLAEEHVKTDADESFIRYEPLGPILSVMPWNFPFWQVIRFAAPALMAGNVGLLKHSSNVPQCALAIEQIFREAGFDHEEFQTLLISADQVAKVIDDERVKATTLTGSEPAGASVASNAAKHIKKSVLELGGSDPFIVMPSADFDEAVKTAVKARIINNGQSCIAAKRFIIHEKIYDRFEAAFVKAMEALKIGDPMDEKTDIGPLAMPQLVDDLDKQVKASVKAGAKVLTGGKRVGRKGNFYAPTVIAEIPAKAAVAKEETFGPVAALFRVRDIGDAVNLANATSFGLGASVWTRNRAEARQFIESIETGMVFINAMVASDPRMPFGGVKRSGYGRELGVHGIREFVNIKTVWAAELARKGSLTE